jgi:hypothetical protein
MEVKEAADVLRRRPVGGAVDIVAQGPAGRWHVAL